MRRRVLGMDELDHTILEFYCELGHPGGEPVTIGPIVIWYNLSGVRDLTDKQRNTVARHMKSLTQDRLLVKVDENRGLYGISELGILYIYSEITDEEREELREARTS